MDPDAALTDARQLAGSVLDLEGHDPDDARDLAERFRALDQWIAAGGFLPRDWDPTYQDNAAPTHPRPE